MKTTIKNVGEESNSASTIISILLLHTPYLYRDTQDSCCMFNTDFLHFSQQKTTPKLIICNPVTP